MKLWANDKIRFVLTSQCNLNCFYCHNEGQPKMATYMTTKLFDHIVSIIKSEDQKISSIKFTGGEPLLHNELEEFIRKIKDITPSRSIVTNGLLLTSERLDRLLDAGLTKIRLGVDSLEKQKSRPSDIYESKISIHNVIDMLLKKNVDFEMNTVITKFNKKEVASLLKFSQEFKISAKFIELIKVNTFGDENTIADLESSSQLSISNFENLVYGNINNATLENDPEVGEANKVYKGEGFEIRYCKHLCDYNLCYITGTRIDPDGMVHTCMSQRGRFRIDPNDDIEISKAKILESVNIGCPH